MSDPSRGKNRYTLTWEIDDFYWQYLKYFDSRKIRSPLFIADNLGRSAWFLTIKYVSCDSKNRAECSIVRYSEDEGIEQIPIQFVLSVTSADDLISVSSVKDASSVITFKKGYSSLLCHLVPKQNEDQLLKSMILKCQMTEYSTVEHPISSGSTVQSNFTFTDWIPEGLSEMKLLSCSQGIQYEVFFHVIKNTVSIRIRRSDRNNSIRFYMNCTSYIDLSTLCSMSKDRYFKAFNINDTIDMPTTFTNDELSKSKFKRQPHIYLVILNSFVTNVQSCSLEGKLAEINTADELDSIDVWRKEQLRMHEDGIHSDVKLQIGSKSIPAHKNILASRSPVFSAMFEGGMVEQQTGVVNITDMDASTLDALLKYMYAAVVEGLEYEKALKLLVAADKYQVMSLKEKCASHLVECLSAENVCEVLSLADLVSQPALKSKAVDYVKAHAEEVLLSDSWKQFVRNNVNLAAETVILISGEYGQKKRIKEVENQVNSEAL